MNNQHTIRVLNRMAHALIAQQAMVFRLTEIMTEHGLTAAPYLPLSDNEMERARSALLQSDSGSSALEVCLNEIERLRCA